MMSFCKRSVHSFLGFSNSKDNGTVLEYYPRHHRNIPSPAGGLSLFTVSNDVYRPANIIESAAVIKSPPSSPPTTTTSTYTSTSTSTSTSTFNFATMKRDPGGLGFLDAVGGSVDGLMSCTESLGFESSDERRVDDQIENIHNDELCSRKTSMVRSRWKKTVANCSEVKKFPPPLSSLNDDGKPTFFLRPVREDGRLKLTGVKIDRPEIFRASRQDGRLRLHLIRDDDVDNYIEEKAEEVEQEIEEEEVEAIEKIEEEKAEERVEGWRFPVTSGGGDGFRRCHELISHHHHHQVHHHNLHMWSQHCVTTG